MFIVLIITLETTITIVDSLVGSRKNISFVKFVKLGYHADGPGSMPGDDKIISHCGWELG